MASMMVLLHLRYSEVECDFLICFFSLRRSLHSASIASVIHGFFLLWHFIRTSVALSLSASLKVSVNLMEFPPNTELDCCMRFGDFNPSRLFFIPLEVCSF